MSLTRHFPAVAMFLMQPRNKTLRILLVEDQKGHQLLTKLQVAKIGIAIDIVEDNSGALQSVRLGACDLILMDLRLETESGFDIARNIRAMEQTMAASGESVRPPVYIIAVTAFALSGDRELCLAAGMNDYVSKPAKEAILLEAIMRGAAQLGFAQ